MSKNIYNTVDKINIDIKSFTIDSIRLEVYTIYAFTYFKCVNVYQCESLHDGLYSRPQATAQRLVMDSKL